MILGSILVLHAVTPGAAHVSGSANSLGCSLPLGEEKEALGGSWVLRTSPNPGAALGAESAQLGLGSTWLGSSWPRLHQSTTLGCQC